MRWNIVKIACLIIVVLFVPSLRSCGDISLGFPTVAYGQGDAGQGYRFDVLNATLNAVIISAVSLVLWRVVTRVKSQPAKGAIQSGLTGILIYHGFIVIGYLILYPLISSASSEQSVIGIIGSFYLAFIHPQFFIADWLSDFIPRRWAESRFFGDSFDIPMRLGYVVVCGVWFGAGALVDEIRRRKKPAAAPFRTPPM